MNDHDPRCSSRHHDADECFEIPPDPTQPPDSPGFMNGDPARWPCVSSLAFLDAPERELERAVERARGDLETWSNLSTTFRHSGWRRERLLILEALIRTAQTRSRRTAFRTCGSDAYVLQSLENPNIYRIAGSSCHDRFCLPCARERSNAIALNVLERVKGKTLRFLTLTVKSTDETLENRLDHLYLSFQALRRRAFWRQKVTGGVAFLELTWNETKQRWHPHFHILIEGAYLPWRKLKAIWWDITKDSHIIDIRPVRDTQTAARYVTKYCGRPFNSTFVNRPQRLDEAILALKGRKLIITFASWRGITLARTPDAAAWENIGPLEHYLKYGAQQGGGAEGSGEELADYVRRANEARASPRTTTTQEPLKNPPQTRLFEDDVRSTTRRQPQQPT